MSNATTTTPLPPMPTWATDRQDSDTNVPEHAWSEFRAQLGRTQTLNVDDFTRTEIILSGVAYTAAEGSVPPMEPIIELYDTSASYPAVLLTLSDARALAGLLTAAADRIEAGR